MQYKIDFENFPADSLVSGFGAVTFVGGAVIHTGPATPHSGTKYLASKYLPPIPGFGNVPQAPLAFDFQGHPDNLSLWVGTEYTAPLVYGWLQGQDSHGTIVAVDGINLLTPDKCATQFSLNAPGKGMKLVTLLMWGFDANGMAFTPIQAVDDFEYDIEFRRVGPVPRPPWLLPPPWRVPPLQVAFPREKWADHFAVALQAVETAQMIGDAALRKEAESVARKLSAIASESMKQAATVR